MSATHDHDAVAKIVSGLVSMGDTGDDVDAEMLTKVVTETIRSQFEGHAKIAGSVGATAASCRITSVTMTCTQATQRSADDDKGECSPRPVRVVYQQGPINSGPGRRPPIRWGGGSCVTVGRCTICYEYECSAT